MYIDAGKIIRDAREAQNISLEKLSENLHIRITYLQAIENGRSEILPSPVQARGFIRMVARYLDLDPNRVLTIWDAPSPDSLPTGFSPEPNQPPDAHTGAIPANETKRFPFNPFHSHNNGPASSPALDHEEMPESTSPAQSIFNAIGAQLRERRELLGLSFEDAEKYTNVREDYLVKIEEGRINELESSIQARGMLNNYAIFLNLNADEVMINFANALQLQSAARHFPGQKANERGEKKVRKASAISRFLTPDLFIGVTVIIGFFVLAIYSLVTIPAYRARVAQRNTEVQEFVDAAQTGTATPSPTAVIAQATPTRENQQSGALFNPEWLNANAADADGAAASSSETGDDDELSSPEEDGDLAEPTETETPAPLSGAIQIYIEANQRTFLKVTIDGTVVFTGRTDVGQILPFSGNQIIEVETGNASALQIQYNNRNLGVIGAYGEVKKIVFSESIVQTSTPVLSPTPTATFEPTYTQQADVATPTITITPYIP